MQHLRRIVINLSNTVAAVLAYHAEMLTMRNRLNSVSDIAVRSLADWIEDSLPRILEARANRS